MADSDNGSSPDNDPMNAWLTRYQGVTMDPPPKVPACADDPVQAHLDELAFEAEAADYVRLIHELAPAELKGRQKS